MGPSSWLILYLVRDEQMALHSGSSATFKDEYLETTLWCLRAWLFKECRGGYQTRCSNRPSTCMKPRLCVQSLYLQSCQLDSVSVLPLHWLCHYREPQGHLIQTKWASFSQTSGGAWVMSAHYFGLLQMVLSEHKVLLPVETDGGKWWVTKILDVTKSGHGNQDQGPRVILVFKK